MRNAMIICKLLCRVYCVPIYFLQLVNHGFTNIDALEPNRDMLAVAERKALYHRLIQAYLGPQRLDIESGKFIKQ